MIMKKAFYYLSFLALLVSCNAPMYPEQRFGGKSRNIQSVKTYTYGAKRDYWNFTSTKGSLRDITEEEYDSDGLLIRETEYDKEGVLKKQVVYEYKGGVQVSKVTTDGQGNVVEEVKMIKRLGKDHLWSITQNGKTGQFITNYDPKEKILTNFYPNYTPYRSLKYDDNDRVIVSLDLEGTKIVRETRNEYDERGNLTGIHTTKNGDESDISMEYSEMDIYGNYTKCIIFSDDLPVFYKEYEITYR